MLFPHPSTDWTVQLILFPTAPLLRIVIVLPDKATVQKDGLPLFPTQAYSVICTLGVLQLSVALAINAVGASTGVMVAGLLQEMTGPTVSTTRIVCAHEEKVEQPSAAVQVRAIVDAWGHVPGEVVSE